jgi:hypothetical protein
VWRGDEFIHAGMRGRGAQLEDFVAKPGHQGTEKAKGLWTRLDPMRPADGLESSSTYTSVTVSSSPVLTPDWQHDIGQGILLLDQVTKSFIRKHLGYRFVVYPSGKEVLIVERDVRAGGLPAGRPYLNPL